ncbi:DNA internalization-related competence protein ComEC/Rec2 [Roseateles paludis]|uniref:DNA internalization-related competence protein ComEC/Rec2 n=1 Tax=Roseateles paludis TaxID=3145238 RepID=A0ABV0G3H1_9BURK
MSLPPLPRKHAVLGPGALLATALAWLAGVAAVHALPALPKLAGVLAAGSVLVLGGLALAWVSARWRWLGLAVAVLALAVCSTVWRAQARLSQDLAPAWEGRDLVVTGRIDSLPVAVLGQGGAPGWRFMLERQAGSQPDLPELPQRLMLLSYAAPGTEALKLTAGETWRFTVRLKRPHGLANPGGFDAELWLFEQGVRATGTVRSGTRLAPAPWWTLDAARQALRERLRREVPEPALAGVLAALSVGDQSAISRADWALLRDTGVAHLFSVSGLHVTLFAWLAAGLAAHLWRRSQRLPLRVATPTAARWIGVAAALGYALFSGWGVPAQRTVLMLGTVALLQTLSLRWPWPGVLLVAAVVVTAVDPWALLQPGFWLSFMAVGLLMASSGERPEGWQAHAWQGLRSQLIATVGLAPLSLVCFAQLSLSGLLANLVAIPLVSFVITPLALLGAAVPVLWALGAWLTQALVGWLQWLAAWPGSVWWVPAAPLWSQGLALLGAVLLVLPLPWRLRACGAAMVLPLLWPAVSLPPPGRFELTAPDVGQGNAIVVRTATHTLVYDSGPAYAPGSDAGERVLLPLLRNQGVRRIDALMLSHRDTDHVGGAATLMRGLPVALLRSSLEPEHPLLQAGVPHTPCEAGQRWVWDGVEFELLHPLAGDPSAKPNARSCVLRVRDASGRSALLLGDLPADEEQRLVARETALRTDVLLVPHHGSKTSSSEALLAATRPALALVQAGYRSRFGHPVPSVLARYQAAGIAVVDSPACGAWTWLSNEPPSQGICTRAERPRYWLDRPTPALMAKTPLQGPEQPMPQDPPPDSVQDEPAW